MPPVLPQAPEPRDMIGKPVLAGGDAFTPAVAAAGAPSTCLFGSNMSSIGAVEALA